MTVTLLTGRKVLVTYKGGYYEARFEGGTARAFHQSNPAKAVNNLLALVRGMVPR